VGDKEGSGEKIVAPRKRRIQTRQAMHPDIRRRIVNAKFVFERALRAQSDTGEMSLAVSLLLVHDAVELLMIAIIDYLQVPSKNKRDFMDFWSDLRNAGHLEPPDRIPLETLNKLRVGLKHHGILPRAQTMLDLLPRVRGFFENLLSAYCCLAYAELSLIDLVPDPEVRALMRAAHIARANDARAGVILSTGGQHD
jgi:hypothetical protein